MRYIIQLQQKFSYPINQYLPIIKQTNLIQSCTKYLFFIPQFLTEDGEIVKSRNAFEYCQKGESVRGRKKSPMPVQELI